MPADFDGLTAPACPAGHPAACIATSPEGTSWCRWCEDIEAQRQKVRDVSLLVAHARDERDAARAEHDSVLEELWARGEALEEARLRLALWSGDAGPLNPLTQTWQRWVQNGVPYMSRTSGRHRVTVDAEGVWSHETLIDAGDYYGQPEFGGKFATVTEARAAAEAWLGVSDGVLAAAVSGACEGSPGAVSTGSAPHLGRESGGTPSSGGER